MEAHEVGECGVLEREGEVNFTDHAEGTSQRRMEKSDPGFGSI